jgi:5-methylcytosine-specific restriction enzyme subunit McrC
MTIPVANLYYLLCYAWGEFTPRQMTAVTPENCPDTLHLFAQILAISVRSLHRRGLDTGYVVHEEHVSAVRGRILVGETIRCLATKPKQVVCAFDELTCDVLTNRIIKSTIRTILRDPSLARSVRAELRQALHLLAVVTDIELRPRVFHQVQLHQNNRFYAFLLNVCRFLHESMQPQDQAGHQRFHDVARDPERMRRVFEKFVRNLLARKLGKAYSVGRDRMAWEATALNGSDLSLLPQMETDVTVRSRWRTLLVECKYTEALSNGRFFAEKFRPAHLYQLGAYLRNLEERQAPDRLLEGILLYPAVGVSLSHVYVLHGHRVHIATLDLNQHWEEIERQLLALVREPIAT